MNPALAQREIVLAGVALVAIVLALVIASLGDDGSSGASSDLPEAVPAPVEGGWYEALAAPYRVSRDAPTTACGHRADETTQGVAHPVLPCGTKLVLRGEDTQVLSEVIDNVLVEGCRELEVTEGLAEMLGLEGTAEIEWRFAAETSG